MLSKLILAFAILPAAVNAVGQSVTTAFCSQDGKAHVEYADHSIRTMDPEERQVGCAEMSISEDHRSFGWSMQAENCCTSYPISTAVIVVRDGKKTLFEPGQMVWQWRFIDHGNRIAILSGPVHGNASEASLYDVSSSKRLETWAGSGNPPAWVDGWQNQFAEDSDEP